MLQSVVSKCWLRVATVAAAFEPHQLAEASTVAVACWLSRFVVLPEKEFSVIVNCPARTLAPSPTSSPVVLLLMKLPVTVTVVMSPLAPGLYCAKRMPLVLSVTVLPSIGKPLVPVPFEIRMPLV